MGRRFIDQELSTIVPSSTIWAGGDVYQWITTVGDFEHMIAYAELFWPEFVEYDGCVFRTDVGEENHQEWMTHFAGDRRSVESMINHLDLPYLLEGNMNAVASDDQLSYLGRLLREMWQAKLNVQFHGRRFVVELIDNEDDFLITFFQIRESEGHSSAQRF